MFESVDVVGIIDFIGFVMHLFIQGSAGSMDVNLMLFKDNVKTFN